MQIFYMSPLMTAKQIQKNEYPQMCEYGSGACGSKATDTPELLFDRNVWLCEEHQSE